MIQSFSFPEEHTPIHLKLLVILLLAHGLRCCASPNSKFYYLPRKGLLFIVTLVTIHMNQFFHCSSVQSMYFYVLQDLLAKLLVYWAKFPVHYCLMK